MYVFGEISPHSPNSPLCWDPCLELIRLNFEFGERYRQIRHIRHIRRIRRFVGTLVSSSFA